MVQGTILPARSYYIAIANCMFSRGPWGSLTLFSQPRMLNLASLGAALTVAAIAVEPSLLQIPVFPLSPVESGTASTPRSTFYSELDRGAITDWTGVSKVISSGLRRAVNSGVFGSNLSVQPSDSPVHLATVLGPRSHRLGSVTCAKILQQSSTSNIRKALKACQSP